MDAPIPQLGGRRIEVAPAESGTTLALIPSARTRHRALRPGSGSTVNAEAAREPGSTKVDVGELVRWEGVPPCSRSALGDGNGLEVVED